MSIFLSHSFHIVSLTPFYISNHTWFVCCKNYSTSSDLFFSILLHGPWCPYAFWTSLSVHIPLACISALVLTFFQYLSLQVVLILPKLFKLLPASKSNVFPSFTPHLCPCLFSWITVSASLTSSFKSPPRSFFSFSVIIMPGQFQSLSVRSSRITGKKYCGI